MEDKKTLNEEQLEEVSGGYKRNPTTQPKYHVGDIVWYEKGILFWAKYQQFRIASEGEWSPTNEAYAYTIEDIKSGDGAGRILEPYLYVNKP